MKRKLFPHVTVIIINWNGLKDTRECLNSFKNVKYPNFSLIVIDNCSQINEAAILNKEYQNFFPHFEAIRLEKNYGYAEGCNIGMRYARRKFDPSYFLIMNNDVIVHPDFLINLVSPAEADDSVGICCPKIYCYPERSKVWWGGSYKISIGWRYRVVIKKQTTTSETDNVTGCCTLIKSKVAEKIGLLDTRFFLSGLDLTDYCLRAKRKGFKALYVPSAVIWHKFGQAAIRMNLPQREIMALKAAIIFFSKHGKSYHLPFLILHSLLSFLKKEILESLIYIFTDKEKREKFKKMIKHTVRGSRM